QVRIAKFQEVPIAQAAYFFQGMPCGSDVLTSLQPNNCLTVNRKCGVTALGKEVVDCEHNFKHIAHPASILNTQELAYEPGHTRIWVGSEPATRVCVVDQPNRIGMRVFQRSTKVSERLLKGMEAIEIDEIKCTVLRSKCSKKDIARYFVKYSV